MKQRLLLAALAALSLSSCEKLTIPSEDSSTGEESVKTRNIQFVLKGLDVDYQTRATLASENITDLYVFEGSTLLKHQVSTDTDFGAPTIALTIGAHDLTFIASKADGQSWADGIWTCTKVKDTYGTVLSYTVSSSSTSKQVQLARVNCKVTWTIEDALPSTAGTLSMSVDQCFGLDADLNGTSPSTYTSTLDISSYAGRSGISASVNVLPADHTSGSDISVSISVNATAGTALAAYTNTVTAVANTIANIHGSFFSSASNAAEVSLLTDWTTTTNYDLQ